jgi:GAF domain-containing protein/HAMP domain-containing protein
MNILRRIKISPRVLRWLRPGDWPVLLKIFVSLGIILTAAFMVLTYINSRSLESGLRERIGAEFESLAKSQIDHLADILSEQMTMLRSITLIDNVRDDVARATAQYSGNAAEIADYLAARDRLWQGATNRGSLILSVVDPDQNDLAAQLLDFTATFPDHIEIFVTDRYGGLVAATRRPSEYYQADEEWWQATYSGGTGALFVGQPALDASTGQNAVAIAAPIMSDAGEVIGTIHSTFGMNAIQEAVNNVVFGDTGTATLVNSNSIAIADAHPEHLGQLMPLSWTSAERTQFDTLQSYEGPDEEGNPAILGQATISLAEVVDEAEAEAIHSLGWTLVIHQTEEEAYTPVRDSSAVSILAATLFGTVAITLAMIVARGIVNPIVRLVMTARQMAEGDLDVRAAVRRRDETGELAEAFNAMADRVAVTVRTLEYSVDERTRGLLAAAEVSRATTEMLDMDVLLPQVVNLALDAFRLYYVGLFLLDEEKEYAILRAGTGEAGNMMMQGRHKLGFGSDSMIGQCVATGEPRIALDVGTEATRFVNPFLPDTRSEMALPLRSRGQVIGAMTIQSSREAAFSEADIAVMQTMADQVAVAIDNARLFSQAQSALDEMQATHQRYLTRAWSDYARVARATDYETLSQDQDSLLRAAEPGILQAAQQRRAMILDANGAEEQGSTLIAPIVLRETVIGALGIQAGDEQRQWSEDEIALLEAVAERVALAADNLRLIDETQRRASREQLTREIADSIRSAVTVEGAIQAAIDALGQSLEASTVIARIGKEQSTNPPEQSARGNGWGGEDDV